MKDSITLKMAREYLGKKVQLKFDQQVGSYHPKYNFPYPINYGFVPGTLAPDGCELDAYLLNIYEPLEKAEGVCIAIIHRNDDDDKLIVVPEEIELSDKEIMKQVQFQEKWFDSVVIRK